MDPSSRTRLGPEEIARYSRHLALPGVGLAGQEKLKAARVAIVGLGGLGSPAALYLAAAGVGTLGLIDGDRVEISNLQRQVLFGDADLGEPKVEIAMRRLRALNPGVILHAHPSQLDSTNAMDVLAGYDVVLDGTDNFPARYLINDATVILGIPNVHGSVMRFEGRVALFGTKDGPCYRCLYPEPPPPDVVQDCNDAGVLGVLPGLVGTLQATEVLKLICGVGESLAGRLVLFDGLGLRFRSIGITRDPKCPSCGTREIRELIDYEAFCGTNLKPQRVWTITPRQLASRLQSSSIQLIDVRERWEWEIARLPGARLIPLEELEQQVSSLEPDRETVVYCHRGVRSMYAAEFLHKTGFAQVGNLEGGIDRWSGEVDSTLRRY